MSNYRSFVFIVGLSSMVGQDELAETYPSTRSYYGIWAMVEGLFITTKAKEGFGKECVVESLN
jgi:hypothetical protein